MKKILIVIDMQNDFITGKLGTPEALAIVPKVKEKIVSYKQNNNKIYFTQDTHYLKDPHRVSSIEEKRVPQHCIYATPGWCIIEQLFPYSIGYTLAKNTFGIVDWKKQNFCHDSNFEIEIVGVCTDICVISNALALRAAYPNVPIVVDASCCAGTTPEKHKMALEIMKSCCIDVVNE